MSQWRLTVGPWPLSLNMGPDAVVTQMPVNNLAPMRWRMRAHVRRFCWVLALIGGFLCGW